MERTQSIELQTQAFGRNEGARTPRLLLVADDLTGACDSGVAFAQHGFRTQVLLADGCASADVEVVVRTTDSRDASAAESQRRLLDAIQAADASTAIFKKVDSVFRGNTLLEILSTIELVAHDLVILAPAYPDLGRCSVDGVVTWEDATGENAVPVLQELRSRGLPLRHLAASMDAGVVRAGLEKCLREGEHMLYCDSVSQADLETLVAEASELRHRVLWIGSGGLAHALAAHLRPQRSAHEPSQRNGIVVVFAGSHHAVTQAQLDCLRLAGNLVEADVRDRAGSSLHHAEVLLLHVPRGAATEDDIAASVKDIAAEQVSCMVMTGGDTAATVCRGLGITALSLQYEVAPGVPLALAVGGPYDGVPVILKSGGFGERDALLRIAHDFCAWKEVVS